VLHHDERAVEADVDDPAPLVDGEVDDVPECRDPRAVDHEVEPAVLVHHRVEPRGHRVLDRHVGVRQVRDHDRPPGSREPLRDRRTDPGRTAEHHRHLAHRTLRKSS
jgi:hypothetical protein